MKILIVDDHTLFRDGLKHLLQDLDSQLELVDADGLHSATEQLRQSQFDFVLLDLKLSDTEGLGSINSVRAVAPDTPVIVLSAEQDPTIIHQAIENGAMGFITKSATHEELLGAIQHILVGGVYLPREATALQAARSGQPSSAAVSTESDILRSFSARQREVLHYLVQGKPNKTISRQMNISENTVKAHLSAIFRTLGARNRTEAVYFAARAGLPLE